MCSAFEEAAAYTAAYIRHFIAGVLWLKFKKMFSRFWLHITTWDRKQFQPLKKESWQWNYFLSRSTAQCFSFSACGKEIRAAEIMPNEIFNLFIYFFKGDCVALPFHCSGCPSSVSSLLCWVRTCSLWPLSSAEGMILRGRKCRERPGLSTNFCLPRELQGRVPPRLCWMKLKSCNCEI